MNRMFGLGEPGASAPGAAAGASRTAAVSTPARKRGCVMAVLGEERGRWPSIRTYCNVRGARLQADSGLVVGGVWTLGSVPPASQSLDRGFIKAPYRAKNRSPTCRFLGLEARRASE